MDIRHSWTRKSYSGRGRIQGRDFELEKILSNACAICKKTLKRKVARSGVLETMERFKKRKTCGMVLDGRVLKKSDCLKEFIREDGNPNYKGIMPRCISCKKKIKTYPAQNATGKHCRNCETERRQGLHPEHLKKFAFPKGKQSSNTPFVKGQKAWNKKHDFCTVAGCTNKHLAKGLCSLHYQRKK